MASFFAHAAIPLVTQRAFAWPAGFERRIAWAAALCAVWPDLDLITLAFEIRPNEPLGHRGLAHSLVVALAVALVVSLVGFRKLGIASKPWFRVLGFLAFAAASHGLLDAMTSGDVGVALLAPLDGTRHLAPFKLVAACPGGFDEYLGAWGALTLANELLYVVIPLGWLVTFVQPDAPRRRLIILGLGWAIAVPLLRDAMPGRFTPTMPQIITRIGTESAGKLEDIPTSGLPNEVLVTKLADFRALGLLDVPLSPANPLWSSSFFPSWFGSWAGRWQEGTPRLALRTLFGFRAPSESDARAWIAGAAAGDPVAQQRIWTLAPAEKVDLVLGRLDFPATKQGLERTHDAHPKPRYWFGLCNGASAAALRLPEPYRAVDVVGVDGTRVRFHPNDIKALLAVGFDWPTKPGLLTIGKVCSEVSFDPVATCALNPAVLVIATMNRIGLAKKSFLIDALPSIAKQYYPIAIARVHAGEPRSPNAPIEDGLRVESLVDVEIELTLSSTTLSYARTDQIGRRVGLVPVMMRYTATLALDDAGAIVGGRWTGNPADGPDDLIIVGDEPELVPGGNLRAAFRIPWPLVSELARASADDSTPEPTIDLREK